MNAPYLSPDEVARLLRCDRKTVYKAIQEQRLPATKIGRTLRVKVADLDALAYVPPSGGDPATPRRRSKPREPIGEFTKLAKGV